MPRKTRPKKKRITKRKKWSTNKKRKGNKLKKWGIGIGATLAPSAIAVGIGLIKKLLNTNKGYSDILA